MANVGDEPKALKWKFATSMVMWSVISVMAGVGLFPTMSSYAHSKPDLLWVGAAIVAIPTVIALAYGFTGNLFVGLGTLAGFLASVPVYLASKGGACMALAAILIALRGGYLLFKATRALRASSPPQPPPAPSPSP